MSSKNKQTVNELKNLQDIERELQPHERIVYDVFEPKQPPDKPSFNESGTTTQCDRFGTQS